MQVITARPLTAQQAAARAAWLLAGRDDEECAWRLLWETMNPPPGAGGHPVSGHSPGQRP